MRKIHSEERTLWLAEHKNEIVPYWVDVKCSLRKTAKHFGITQYNVEYALYLGFEEAITAALEEGQSDELLNMLLGERFLDDLISDDTEVSRADV